MDFSELQDKYTPFVKQNFIPLALGFFGLMFLGYGLIAFSGHKQENKDILFEAAQDESPLVKNSSSSAKQTEITVDIEGAVLKPGVYKLPGDSRVQDGLIAAGGLGDNADRGKVTRGLNLAAKLVDSGKIYIPFQGEQIAASSQNILGVSSSNGTVNINTASEQELDGLSGIGKVTAGKIISNRPYGAVEELLEKKIVGKKVFDQIKDKISAN